jgi:hypothetical protein
VLLFWYANPTLIVQETAQVSAVCESGVNRLVHLDTIYDIYDSTRHASPQHILTKGIRSQS